MQIQVEKVNGDEAHALCPAHLARTGKDDHRSSWSINLDTGAHFCFSCGWGGSYVSLVQWAFNWEADRDKAIEWTRKHGGIEVAAKKLSGSGGFEKEVAEEVTEADMALFDDPPAYARKSRDVSLESCRAFGVQYILDQDRWVFPIREPFTNKLMGWQEKGKDVFLNYPKHVEKAHTLFGFDLLLAGGFKTAYLYESPVEPVRLHTYSVDGGVASYGVHVSDTQMHLLADTIDTLYVCLDNDPAGRAKEKKIWAEYRGTFKHLWFVNYDQVSRKQKDHGEMSPEEIEWSLNNAISSVVFRP